MHPCPCCGYRTLPGRGDYDLCPVCWWEDEGLEPWEFSGPNGRTLVAAQLEFLDDQRPYKKRAGDVRAPRKKEARDPDWQPIDLGDGVLERSEQASNDWEQEWEDDQRRYAEEKAANPVGRFAEYNAAITALQERAAQLSHKELKGQLRQLSTAHGVPWSTAYLEYLSRLMTDEHYYRRHHIRAAYWVVRHSRPSNYKRRWQEARANTFTFSWAE